MAYLEERVQMTIRLPNELKKYLQQEAERQGCSLNQIMVDILQEYMLFYYL